MGKGKLHFLEGAWRVAHIVLEGRTHGPNRPRQEHSKYVLNNGKVNSGTEEVVSTCTMNIVHACTMIIVHACTMIIVQAFTMIVIHACNMTWYMHVLVCTMIVVQCMADDHSPGHTHAL